AVAGEVGGAHVGDAADVLQQRDRRVRAVLGPAQPDDAAGAVVGAREVAQAGDDDVVDAVAVEVHDLGVRAAQPAGQDAPGGGRRGGVQRQDLFADGVA